MRKLMGCLAGVGLLTAWGCAHKEKSASQEPTEPVQSSPEESGDGSPPTGGAGEAGEQAGERQDGGTQIEEQYELLYQ